MKRVRIGSLEVSELCLGTMTWGEQNTLDEAHAQMRQAEAAGCNFLDTAELYPTCPVRAETTGQTEEIIGDYIARHGRGDWVIATKIAGKGGVPRGGEGITPEAVTRCIDESLKRLRVEVIDLYQFHWAQRASYHFRAGWNYRPKFDPAREKAQMRACLEALASAVKAGKVREFGLSNETVWGMAQYLRWAEEGLPRAVSMQNEYSLLCRQPDTDFAEALMAERVTMLSFSTLATGLLTGKYSGGAMPEGARATRVPGLSGRLTPQALAAADAYGALAREHGLDPATMAVAWQKTRPFAVVPILGATSGAQLAKALAAADLSLSPEVLAGIERLHKLHPMPF